MKKHSHKRSSSAATRKRLDGYPFAQWLEECRRPGDGEGEEVWLQAEHGVDFHVDVPTFRTELHNLAKRETGRRFAATAGEGLGVRVRTSQVGIPDGDLSFRFEELPFDQCPAFPRPGHHRGANREAVEGARASLDDGLCRLTPPAHKRGAPPSFIACPCRPEFPEAARVDESSQADTTGTEQVAGYRPGDEVTVYPATNQDGVAGYLVVPADVAPPQTTDAGFSNVEDGAQRFPAVPEPPAATLPEGPQPSADFQEWLRQQALQQGGGEGGE